MVWCISRKPTDYFDASASLSYGSYSESIVQGMVSGPLGEVVRGRVAIKTTQNDGWQTNAVDGRKRY